ncbi:hexose transporter Hxt15p [[Candida] jaroonii]|uniref:Hexose transporter Hxt15p n=1 Tax=[Candida] jaroonii TaxID=467808 RepID=A0ACA9Y9F4_9ASCO|nr:hexose transporter Hxt15p [[Candida] jaroonii]
MSDSSDKIQIETFGSEEKVENYIRTDKKWWQVPHLLKLNIAVALITFASSTNGYDGSMLNGLQSLPVWKIKMGLIHPDTGELTHNSNTKLTQLANGTIYGSLLAVPFAPYVCDRYGRIFTTVLGQGITVVGSIIQGCAPNYAAFLIARMILGLGTGFSVVSCPSLISEIAFPTHRSSATGFYNTCWYLGALIAAWTTYGTQYLHGDNAWKVPSFIQGVLPLIQIVFIWMIPESPRYFISRGKHDKARDMLRKHHTGNSDDPQDIALVEFEMKEIEAALEMEKLSTQTSYKDFINKKNFRKRLFLIMYVPCIMQLSGNGLVSYFLNKVLDSIGITDANKQLQINGCLMVYNMVISMAAASTFQFFKRRTLFLTSISCMLVCYILWTILSGLAEARNYPPALSNGVLAFIFLYYASYDIGVNGLPILYVTEILPYTHRAKGMNIFNFTQTCTLIFNGYVNPIGLSNVHPTYKYYIVWCCHLVVELTIVYFFFPETSGYTLEEVAKVFGDDIKEVSFIQRSDSKTKEQFVENVESASV